MTSSGPDKAPHWRLATSDDFAAIASFPVAAGESWDEENRGWCGQLALDAKTEKRHRWTILFFAEGDVDPTAIAGVELSWLEIAPGEATRTLRINLVAVHPLRRYSAMRPPSAFGIADYVMAALGTQARAHGRDAMAGLVDPRNKPSIKMLTRAGFTPLPQIGDEHIWFLRRV